MAQWLLWMQMKVWCRGCSFPWPFSDPSRHFAIRGTRGHRELPPRPCSVPILPAYGTDQAEDCWGASLVRQGVLSKLNNNNNKTENELIIARITKTALAWSESNVFVSITRICLRKLQRRILRVNRLQNTVQSRRLPPGRRGNLGVVGRRPGSLENHFKTI